MHEPQQARGSPSKSRSLSPRRATGTGRAYEASTPAPALREPVTFLEANPRPEGLPRSRVETVRVLVAANGYIDSTETTPELRAKALAARAKPLGLDDFISCTDSFVQLHTTYTDTKRFLFHKVFGSTTATDGMFTELLPSILDVTNGINAHIIMYGQCGTGKTHLVQGEAEAGSAVGLLPRTLIELFSLREQLGLVMTLSVFGVNGEIVNDLLSQRVLRSLGVDAQQHSSRILSDKAYVNDVLLLNRLQMLELLNAAMKESQRKVLGAPDRASQHIITQITVERDTASGAGLQGVLTFSDLCGYEVTRTSDRHLHLQQSLMNFGRLVSARSVGEFVAASSGLLTRLLFDSCGGNSRTVLIATISSMQKDLKSTLHTLHIARRAMSISGRPRFNYASRKDTPTSVRGKSRSGQSFSLIHRFTRGARGGAVAPVELADPITINWKAQQPVIVLDPKSPNPTIQAAMSQTEFWAALEEANGPASSEVADDYELLKRSLGFHYAAESPTTSEEAMRVEESVNKLLTWKSSAPHDAPARDHGLSRRHSHSKSPARAQWRVTTSSSPTASKRTAINRAKVVYKQDTRSSTDVSTGDDTDAALEVSRRAASVVKEAVQTEEVLVRSNHSQSLSSSATLRVTAYPLAAAAPHHSVSTGHGAGLEAADVGHGGFFSPVKRSLQLSKPKLPLSDATSITITSASRSASRAPVAVAVAVPQSRRKALAVHMSTEHPATADDARAADQQVARPPSRTGPTGRPSPPIASEELPEAPIFAGITMAFAVKKKMLEVVTELATQMGATVLTLVNAVKLCIIDPSQEVTVVTTEREHSRLPALLRRVSTRPGNYCQVLHWDWMEQALDKRHSHTHSSPTGSHIQHHLPGREQYALHPVAVLHPVAAAAAGSGTAVADRGMLRFSPGSEAEQHDAIHHRDTASVDFAPIPPVYF